MAASRVAATSVVQRLALFCFIKYVFAYEYQGPWGEVDEEGDEGASYAAPAPEQSYRMSGNRPFVTHDLNNVFLTYQKRLGGSFKHTRSRFHSSESGGNSGLLTAGNLAESALTKRGGDNLMDAYRNAMQHFMIAHKDDDKPPPPTPKPHKKDFIQELQEDTNVGTPAPQASKPKKDFIQELQEENAKEEHFAKPPAPIPQVPGGSEDAFENNVESSEAAARFHQRIAHKASTPKKNFIQELQEQRFIKPHLPVQKSAGPSASALDEDLPPSARLPEPRLSMVETSKQPLKGFAAIQNEQLAVPSMSASNINMNAQSFTFNNKKAPAPIDVGFAELPPDARLPYREPRLSLSESSADSWASSIPWESTEASVPMPQRASRRHRSFRGKRNAQQYRRNQRAPQRMQGHQGSQLMQSMQHGYQGGRLMQSMQQQFSQDLMSVESSPPEYRDQTHSYDEAQGSEKPLPDLRLYRSPNRKPLATKVGSLFDGGIDVREERRRKEQKLWAPHPRASMPDVESAMENAMTSPVSAPTPLAMNSQTPGRIEMAPRPHTMAEMDDTSNFAAPTPLAMNVQATSNVFSADAPTPLAMDTKETSHVVSSAAAPPLAMNTQASRSIQDTDGMLDEMRSEVNGVAMHPKPPAMRRESQWGNAHEMRRPRGRDPIMSKLADVQRKLLALNHKGHPKVEMKASPLIPDDDSPEPMPAPQSHPEAPARHHNRLWDTHFERPPVQVPPEHPQASMSADMAVLTKMPEAPPHTRVAAPPKKKFAKASVKARKPPVKALLSHKVNKDAKNSFNSVFSGKISIPALPSVTESRAAIESQEAKKEVVIEEAAVTVSNSESPSAPTDPSPSQKPQAPVKTDSDTDGDSDVGTSDSDEEDDKDLAKLEKQVDDFEEQQHQAMADDKDATDSP
eukprot:gnl/MRDRNA2_/MRDRNA2_124379_c0_seq1.p1 gnl/MRDRNA2_/MRDRNA2_124379_c0~~gnl/MRDRNA2_/MRDRNA2_124379_c0_seq1.p1  ORF type:complete len:910 (-),score=215.78 gnl/MRDRNA2_/MRDRNA2_124379_c0_seq1:77-2806(-)